MSIMRKMTARARLETWAHVSRAQRDEVTYGLQLGTDCVSDTAVGGSEFCGDVGRCGDVDVLEHVAGEGRVASVTAPNVAIKRLP